MTKERSMIINAVQKKANRLSKDPHCCGCKLEVCGRFIWGQPPSWWKKAYLRIRHNFRSCNHPDKIGFLYWTPWWGKGSGGTEMKVIRAAYGSRPIYHERG